MRLVDYAKQHLVVVPIDDVGALIAGGALSINGRSGRIAELVHADDVVTVDDTQLAPCALQPEPVPLVIHYEDDELLVCDKPAGMHVHPLGPYRDGTLLNALLWQCGARPGQPWGSWRPRPLHRLDRAASGLMAIAKGTARPVLERRYHALVHGHVALEAATIASPLGRDPTCDYRRGFVPVEEGGQHAVTHYKRISHTGERTLLELTLETGRTHQIRAHLAGIGHPIVGDTLYATGGERSDSASVIALHASELRFRHPQRDELIVCTSPHDFATA